MARGPDPARSARLSELRADLLRDLGHPQPGGAADARPADPERQQEVLEAFQEWHAGGDNPSMTFLENLAGRDGDSVGPLEVPPAEPSGGGEDATADWADLTGPDADVGGFDLGAALVDHPFTGPDGGPVPGGVGPPSPGFDLPDLSVAADPGLAAVTGVGQPTGHDLGAEVDLGAAAGLSSAVGPGGGLDPGAGFDLGAGLDPGGSGPDLVGAGLGAPDSPDGGVGLGPDSGVGGFDAAADPAAGGTVGGGLDGSVGFAEVDPEAGGFDVGIDPGSAGGFEGGGGDYGGGAATGSF